MESLINLSQFELEKNQISEISRLGGLKELYEIDLAYNDITEVKGHDGLLNLRSIILDYNQVSRVEDLLEIPGRLDVISMIGNPFEDPCLSRSFRERDLQRLYDTIHS